VYTIELTPGGYVIKRDGTPYILQAGDPDAPGFAPFTSEAAAQAHAELILAELPADEEA
jgi:hypothetical protein